MHRVGQKLPKRQVWENQSKGNNMSEKFRKIVRTPEEAAAKVTEVWEDPRAWWSRTSVQDARRAFCALQALTLKGDENHYWIPTLKSL